MGKIGESNKALTELSDSYYDDRVLKRGEIYYLDLSDAVTVSSYVTNKTRPALIIQNDTGNLRSQTTIVAPMTTRIKKTYPFQYYFNLNGKDSAIMFEQIMTVDRYRILEKCGELNAAQMKEAERCLMHSLALDRFSLENVERISVTSMVTKKTRDVEKIYFEVDIHFENNQKETIRISLGSLQEYNSLISSEVGLDELEDFLNCCEGLHWLVTRHDC